MTFLYLSVQLKKEFDEYEKNKLVKEKYEISVESCDLKISSLKDKLKMWEEIQDKISENQKIEGHLIKADLRLEELEREKTKINSIISQVTFHPFYLNSFFLEILSSIYLFLQHFPVINF